MDAEFYKMERHRLKKIFQNKNGLFEPEFVGLPAARRFDMRTFETSRRLKQNIFSN